MTCFSLYFLFLGILCTCRIVQLERLIHLSSLNNNYARISSLPAAAPGNPASTREYSVEMTQTNKYGLPKCAKKQNECQQIGIVGAGAAGLYCGILLAESGHTVTIYEASDRAGGRILTYRDPKNPSMYIGELGAMRFPLDVQPYLNNLIRERYKLNITEFDNSNDNAFTYINGVFATIKEARDNPDIFKFNTSQSERGKTSDELWSAAIQPILETLAQGGWSSVRNQWDSYSIDSYLNKMNMSRGASDYISIFDNFETDTFTAILEAIHFALMFEGDTKYYRIEDGNDWLIRTMVADCQAMESNRCSIVHSTPIIQIKLNDSHKVRLTTKNVTSAIFDSVIVATTATAAQLIDFDQRIDFIDKYRALRQLHYDCATKILLSFNESWWFTQENITGGQSITDLLIRNVFYPSTSNNQTNGGTLLGSYTYAQDSLIWQSLSDSDAIELALKQLIQLHKSSSNIRNYFQGGKVKHWCGDPYSHGAFAVFLPFQETKLFDQLQLPISNIHFIGEHTSLMHGWVEGALVSAVRAALDITAQTETIFDVIIVGGGPVGLMTAVVLSLKQPGFRIAIVEKGTVGNSEGSSGTFDQRQFRQIYEEEYLSELANMSFHLWRQLEQLANLSVGSILNTNDGYLFFGDFNSRQSTIEGNLTLINRTCQNLQLSCEYLNNSQLQIRYPIFNFSSQYEGIFHNQSGYINVTMLMTTLFRFIDQNPNIIIRQQEEFLSLQLDNYTQIQTNRGILRASQKILFVPGPYVKNISRLLNFDLNVTLWELPVYYFRRLKTNLRFPTWFARGENDLQSFFSGFSIDSPSDYIVIIPNFIANLSNPLIYPSQRTNIIDPLLTQKVIQWVSRHLGAHINVTDYYPNNRTCLATFLPDNGFLLDYVPRTNKRVLIQAAGWGMKFVPIWGDLLSDMILFEINSSSKYEKYIDYFALSRPNRLIEEGITLNKGQQLIFSSSSSSLSFLFCFLIVLH